jgi:hypothetical protein
MRRIVVSAGRIEQTIAAGQKRGLTATGVRHYADGTVTVHFGGGVNVKAITQKKPSGWDI